MSDGKYVKLESINELEIIPITQNSSSGQKIFCLANEFGTNFIHLIEIKFSSLQRDSNSAIALVKNSWDMSELLNLQRKEFETISK